MADKKLEEKINDQAIKDREQVVAQKEANFAEREQNIAAKETALRVKETAEFVEQAIADGKVLPRDKDGLVAFMASLNTESTIEFGEGDTRKTVASNAFMREFISRLPKAIEYAERAGGNKQVAEFSDPTAIASEAVKFQESEAAAGRIVNIAEAVARVKTNAAK